MAHLCNTNQGGSESSQAFHKRWSTLSYKFLITLSHKVYVGMILNSICSLIVGLNLKSLAKLTKVTHDAESILRELENPSERIEFLFPIIINNYQSFEDTLNQSQVEYNQEDDATFEISQDNNYYCSSNDGHACSSNNASAGEDDLESFTRFEDDD